MIKISQQLVTHSYPLINNVSQTGLQTSSRHHGGTAVAKQGGERGNQADLSLVSGPGKSGSEFVGVWGFISYDNYKTRDFQNVRTSCGTNFARID